MGNAMLIKAGGGSSGGSGGSGLDQIFVHNGVYICNKTGNYKITCVGGGGGGSKGNGTSSSVNNIGCSGYNGNISSKVCLLNEGEKYEIIIGAGGAGVQTSMSNGSIHNDIFDPSGYTGGTTSFSTLVSATGGSKGPLIQKNDWANDTYHNITHVIYEYPDTDNSSRNWIEYGTRDDYLYTDDGYNFSYSSDDVYKYPSNYGYGGGGTGLRIWRNVTTGVIAGYSQVRRYFNNNNIHRGGDGCITIKYLD